jgi:hypothetical protein
MIIYSYLCYFTIAVRHFVIFVCCRLYYKYSDCYNAIILFMAQR